MATNEEKNLNNLKQLKKLATRTNKELTKLDTRVGAIEKAGYQTETQVDAKINSKVSSAYKPGGSKAPAELTDGLLVAENEGKVYNIKAKLTINSSNKNLFVEGVESSYPAGTNFVVVNDAEAEAEPDYKFDALAGFVDLSGLVEKIESPAEGNLAAQGADGKLVDSGIAKDDVQKKLSSGAFTEGNFRVTGADGFARDAGYGVASDEEVDAMLLEVFGPESE